MNRPPAAGTPRWALGSALLAPLALIGGWSIGAVRQPAGYSSTRDTISALAAHGATDRWIMTAGLALLGAAYLCTAAGLPAVRPAGRLLLGIGGLATLLVAVFAQPAHGSSAAHVTAAAAAFVALACWPVAAAPAGERNRSRWAIAATVGLLLLLGWFGLSLGTSLVGLAERVLAGAEALVPLGAVLAIRAGARPAAS